MIIKEIFTKKNRLLLKAMVSTDFKLRYQQSVLGYVWSVLKPLMLFAIMYVVFIRFLKFGADVPHFAVALLLGIIMWNFFNETTTGGMMSIVGHGDLLRKIYFQKHIVVIASSMSALINFGFNFIVVILFCMLNGVMPSPSWLLIIPILIEEYLLALGVAFFLAAVYVNLRDLNPIWEVVMQAGFYGTPIIYPISMISSRAGVWGPLFAKLDLALNPMAQIVQDARHVMISTANPTIWEWVKFPYALWPVVFSLLIFFGGFHYFTVKSKHFAELV
ncbi:ABC transporter permease [Bifidobacterium callitrichos]|uniref:Transport permease protein n=1 Tax=Bifidobacterium callitrichos DSM 23973 TaxID=1437609 RepID=A0A087A4Z7_9BIFI|nr:ABC transporter permease [Bifidobacterium callitrichos]KFI53847.1 ABC transporter [Bifidobacterium callitrichos DSM 23973]